MAGGVAFAAWPLLYAMAFSAFTWHDAAFGRLDCSPGGHQVSQQAQLVALAS
ncbi:hypothetical protein C660_10806 [Alcaligenes sp. HPC1271]|nr:hypothetical protein C660_10806 [Alcaligenes sp. HPC1271]